MAREVALDEMALQPHVPVADIDTARRWYERLLGREADNRPMDSLAEWWVTDTGWLQVHHDAGRAGTALLNFAVDDLRPA